MADIIDVNIGDSTLEVFWQDEVELNLDLALMYIKSGQAEIQDYVDNVSKPEISNYVETTAKPLVTEIVNEIAEPVVLEYIENTAKPDIDNYVEEKKPELEAYVTQAQTYANNSQASATASANSAAEAKTSETNALSSKNSAATSAQNAANSATQAKEYAQDAATSASLAQIENKISNCITKIPQDIKLELNNGTLTLKAGSKIYVPNGKNADGSNKFDEVIISNDKSVVLNTEGLYYLNQNGGISGGFSNFFSGNTEPTFTGTVAVWYDTANNVVKRTSDSGASWVSGNSLPFAFCTPSSIDQVFNGFGYIGSTIFALPGVEGLIPNGRNTDGSLNSIKFTIASLTVFNIPGALSNASIGINGDNLSNIKIDYMTFGGNLWSFNNNQFYFNKSPRNWMEAGLLSADSTGRITSFSPKHPIKLPDEQDVVHKTGNETISGHKLFTVDPFRKATNVERGIAPSSTQYASWMIVDKNQQQIANYYINQTTDNSITANMIATNLNSSDNPFDAKISVTANRNGTTTTYAPTPPTSDNSSQIATTAWFNQKVQVVSTLPASPDANVYYFIPE